MEQYQIDGQIDTNNNFLTIVKSLKRSILIALGILLFVSGIFTAIIVLFDSFNDIAIKTLLTVGSVFLYSTATLMLVWDDERDWYKEYSFFSNTLMVLLVISFLAMLADIWGIIGTSARLQITLIVLGFGVLGTDVLGSFLNKNKYLNYSIITSQTLLAILILFILVSIHFNYFSFITQDYHNRLIAALAVLLGSAVGLSAVLYRLLVPKPAVTPDTQIKKDNRNGFFSSIYLVLRLILIVPIIFSIIGFLFLDNLLG